ncbi:RNApolymerase sigma-subunit C [Wolffia australiana]
MRAGVMADWRCSLPVQSPAPAGPSTRPLPQYPQSASPARMKESFFEAAKVSILRSIPEEGGVLHAQVLRSCVGQCASPQKIRRLPVQKEEREEEDDGSSLCNLQFSLLMENLGDIEEMLVDSAALSLQRDILAQIERLGALELFDDCLSAPNEDDPGENSKLRVSQEVVRSGRKEERKSRRQRLSGKAADGPVLARTSEREAPISPSSGRKRLVLARNESRMSMGVKEVAKLEKIRDELEQRTGRVASFSRWAEEAGMAEKTLHQRLHFGWHCKDSLLRSTRSLVIYLARGYRGMGIAFDDLIQAGNVGVLRGAERFDSSRGYRFSTYVQYWIRKSMLAMVGRYSRGIHIPATMEKTIKEVQKARRTLSSSDHRYPRDADVAELTGIPLAKVRLAGRCGRVVGSINQKKGDAFNIKAAETMADASVMTPGEAVMREHMKNDIYKLLEGLHPRERQVLLHRYGLVDGRRRSLEEIGQLLRVSKEWIRKLEIAGLAKIRKEDIRKELEYYVHPRSV